MKDKMRGTNNISTQLNKMGHTHFLQVKELERHRQNFYTIEQDWAHPITYTIEKSKSPI
jgi:hypothetical protein